MGSNSEAMERAVEYAVAQYGDTVAKYGLSFGTKEICFMLYRGALTVDELDSYIAKDIANTPMARHKAAVVITKAMAAEKKAKAELILDLTYNDAKNIPAASSKYVYYVTKSGIMTGMEGNLFAPNLNLTRAQISVMLSRAVDKMGISFVDTTLTEVRTTNGTIVTADEVYSYTSDTVMYSDGQITDASSMPKNADATLVFVNDEIVFVDAYTTAENGTKNAVFYDYSIANDITSLKVKFDDSSSSEYIECSQKAKFTRDGQSASISAFEIGDRVSVTIENGVVTEMSANQDTTTIADATIEKVNISAEIEITISHDDAEYDGATYLLGNDAVFYKNGVKTDFSNLLRGDEADLTIEYGKIVKVKATSKQKTVEGTIKEIHISAEPYMIVDVNGNEEKYDIASAVKIKINGEDGSLYDFRLLDTVKITIESQAITSISATSLQSTSKNITAGTVIGVNASYGSIRVSYNDNGVTKEETVICKQNGSTTNTKIMTANGKEGSMRDIKEGTVISIRGNVENGSFIASLIIIEE